MTRFALLVDAGYVKCIGKALLECASVDDLTCNVEALVQDLRVHALSQLATHFYVRTYWYDAAADAVPTAEHEAVAEVKFVKLRLGRLIQGRQKGVDALIVRDLMTLAAERAIDCAFLVAGDDDLREGIMAAQDKGVQVYLFGAPYQTGAGQAKGLLLEADQRLIQPLNWWRNYFAKR